MEIFLSFLGYVLLGSVWTNRQVSEVYSFVGIGLISLVMIVYIFRHFHGKIQIALLVGLVLRLALLALDYFTNVPILHSGSDTEKFYETAVDNLGVGEDFYLTSYGYLLTKLFELIGPQRLFAQFINVLLGMGTLFYFLKILRLLKVSYKKTLIALWILVLMPQMIIFSGILLRESLIIFLATVSFYYLVEWYLGRNRGALFALVTACGAAVLHSGMLGWVFGIAFIILFYNRQYNRISFSVLRVSLSSAFLIGFVVLLLSQKVFTAYLDPVLNTEGEGISSAAVQYLANSSTGHFAQSSYLTSLNYASVWEVVLFSPLKVLYFLSAPMPWDWRSLVDAIAFALDSTFYLFCLWGIYFKKRKGRKRSKQGTQNFVQIAMVGFWIAVVLYSFGTSTAGTAIRHRANFFPILLVISFVCSISRTKQVVSNQARHLEIDRHESTYCTKHK